MSWSVIKSFKNWRKLINSMVDSAKKYVVCDIRVANVEDEFFDENIVGQNIKVEEVNSSSKL